MKILLILTGGTIGSSVADGVISLAGKAPIDELLELYRHAHPETEFVIEQPLNLSSENLVPEDWNTLCAFMDTLTLESYDGIILTHGTDTLPYTSALLAMLYRQLPVPMVITAANRPFGSRGSNAFVNIAAAVSVLEQVSGGIYVTFTDSTGCNIYLPTRLCEAGGYTDDFTDFTGTPYARLRLGEVTPSENTPTLGDIARKKTRLLSETPRLTDNVLLLRSYPGLDYDSVRLDGKKAVLVCLYHSGTCCTVGAHSSLPIFAARCRAAGIPLFVCSVKGSGERYESAVLLQSGDIQAVVDTSFEAAYVKLCIAAAQGELPLRELMNENVYYERIGN